VCGMFQKDGILCAHILAVLIRINKHKIPEKYFIERWRPAEKRTASEVPSADALIHGNSSLRYNILSRKMVMLSSDAAKSVDRYKYLCKEANRLSREINAIPLDENTHTAPSNEARCQNTGLVQFKKNNGKIRPK
jgi:hypothetical protein